MADTLYRKRGRRYIETSLAEQDAWGDQGLMILAAFRYCVGRQTYMPDVCADWLIRHWAEFPARTRALVQREIEETFARDDEARAEGRDYKPLGWDCDRRDWERVRALWADAPPAEPYEMTPAELAHRAKWLVGEMEAVGQAMVRAGQSTGDANQRAAGWDLLDATSALQASIKDKK